MLIFYKHFADFNAHFLSLDFSWCESVLCTSMQFLGRASVLTHCLGAAPCLFVATLAAAVAQCRYLMDVGACR